MPIQADRAEIEVGGKLPFGQDLRNFGRRSASILEVPPGGPPDLATAPRLAPRNRVTPDY